MFRHKSLKHKYIAIYTYINIKINNSTNIGTVFRPTLVLGLGHKYMVDFVNKSQKAFLPQFLRF